jgi:hypothetical protein
MAWLLGDIFKTSYFLFGDADVTWQFQACAVIQSSFDLGIMVQFLIYGNRQGFNDNEDVVKHVELEEGMSKL